MAKGDETLASGDLLVVGTDYYVRMRGTGKLTIATYNGKSEYNGYNGGRTTYTYRFTNKSTGRDIITRSKTVIKRPV